MLISQIKSGGYSPPASVEPSVSPPVPISSAPPSAAVELPSQAIQATGALLKEEQLQDAVNRVNEVILTMTNDVKFTVDSDTGIRVIKVVDTRTDEVIRQFPSEEMVELAKSMDKLRGLVIRQKA